MPVIFSAPVLCSGRLEAPLVLQFGFVQPAPDSLSRALSADSSRSLHARLAEGGLNDAMWVIVGRAWWERRGTSGGDGGKGGGA